MPECGAPQGPPGVYGCCTAQRTSDFENQVADAIRAVQRDNPDMFNGDRLVGSPDAYVELVAKKVASMFGLCTTVGGPDDEIGVKNSNNYSEQFDILFSSGEVNHYGYTVTCKPARF